MFDGSGGEAYNPHAFSKGPLLSTGNSSKVGRDFSDIMDRYKGNDENLRDAQRERVLITCRWM
jgi:hypothetical protein